MTVICEDLAVIGKDPPVDYRFAPTAELVCRIAYRGDPAALREFHEHRRLFRIKEGPPLLLVEFVQAVLDEDQRTRFFGLPTSVLERAYDITIDKFSVLPAGDAADLRSLPGSGARCVKRMGADCRYYFKVIARTLAGWQRCHPDADPSALEAEAGRVVQRRVACHCWWSCLEARRNHRHGWSRFSWQLPNASVTVWMPRWMSGRRRGAWLAANVPAPDPARCGERERIQAIVDGHFGALEPVALDEHVHTKEHNERAQPVINYLVEHEIAAHGLAGFVAREKSIRINQQRRAIRRLGKKRLQALILRIFDEVASGRLEDRAIARAFGLSAATYSRFAGRRWEPGDDRPAPDLWRNVAKAVACCSTFRESAEAAGVWGRIEAVIYGNDRGGSNNA